MLEVNCPLSKGGELATAYLSEKPRSPRFLYIEALISQEAGQW